MKTLREKKAIFKAMMMLFEETLLTLGVGKDDNFRIN